MYVEHVPSVSRPFGRLRQTASILSIGAGIAAAAAPLPAAVAAQPDPLTQAAAADPSENGDTSAARLHIALGTDYTTAYFFRGFAYEDTGLIIQPWADFSFDIARAEQFTASLLLGSWNSFHGQATDAGTSDDLRKYWFESDVSVGLGVAVQQWSLRAVYNWYTSPSDAFETTEEIMFEAVYEDEGLLPAGWTLLPELTLAIETGSVANDGYRKGAFLLLGVSPGVEFEAFGIDSVDLRFPIRLGLSLSNYYEGDNGENDVFGYASAGAELTVPLPLDASCGAWSLHAGIEGLFLGDVAASSNADDDFQFIATTGVCVEF